ncbi:hypothetical protein JCM18905_1175 [Vibrio sp. JCM 18905]|nr:hypothetical protein JCM18905_1175 [Vibrio sp. JCM 18905]
MRPVSLIARYVKGGDNHMDNFRNLIKDFMEDEEGGLTLLEYILGAALIVTAFLTSGFWTTLSNKFTSVAGRISSS